MNLSQKLIQLRKERGWTQAHAAQHIDIQQSYLSKLENGHFVPSDDVISKLCNAYNVKQEVLTQSKSKPKENVNLTKRASILLTISFFLILAGQFSLFFSQTYYNYKAQPVDMNKKTSFVLNFHLTDQYLGEKYIETIEGNKYTFELVAQRDVPRKENGWLTAIGMLIMLSTVSYLLLKRIRD
jgi:transcriptional regulator with XRE-family HTH domain